MKNHLLSIETFKLISRSIAMLDKENLDREEIKDIVFNLVNAVSDDVSKDFSKNDLATKGDLGNANLTLDQKITLLHEEFKLKIAENNVYLFKCFLVSQMLFFAIMIAILK